MTEEVVPGLMGGDLSTGHALVDPTLHGLPALGPEPILRCRHGGVGA